MRARRLSALLLAVAAAPAVLAVGFGWWNTPGAWIQAAVLAGLTRISEWVEQAPPVFHGALGPTLLAAALGAAVAGAARGGRSFRAAGRAVEELAAALGWLGAAGLFAVGAGLDRPLFWGGVATALLAAGPRADGLSPPSPLRRGLTAATAIGLAIAGGLTLLEGPSMHTPAFRLRDLWLWGPGASAWTSGGAWLLAGASVAGACMARNRLGSSNSRLTASRGRALAALGVAAGVLAWELSGGVRHLATAEALSAAGLLAGAWGVSRVLTRVSTPPTPAGALSAALPLLAWTATCALRGLTVGMWTVPPALPSGVEQVFERQDLFSLAYDPATDSLLFTDRERDEVGRLHADGRVTTWEVWDPAGVGVEEVAPPRAGTAWISIAGEEEARLMAVDLERGPGRSVRVPACWISDWIELPDRAAARRADAEPGDVLVACESSPVLRLFRPETGHRSGVLELAHEVEHGLFAPEGDRLWAVGLWHTPSVIAYAWPGGEVLSRRVVGPFNWQLAAAGGRIWVTRFFEGGLLGLDAQTLAPEVRVDLSFGVRAVLFEPVGGRLWAAAAYSGRLWSVDPGDPSDRRVYGLCGQARDLAADARGRVYVATDCGLFRVDETGR